MVSTRKELVPHYITEFSCIGSACEDTCCAGWRVEIDQVAYKKYKKVRDAKLGPELDKNMKRNRSNPTAASYAYIALDEKGSCTFLTEEKLCGIQLKLGEGYLSNTCSTYPRYSSMVGETLETSGTFSCPEMARLALLNPNGIQFDEIDEDKTKRNMIHNRINPDRHDENLLQRHFWGLRIFTIQTLQNRKYSLQDRMVLLGLFYSKLQKYVEEDRISEVPDLIASYTNLFADPNIHSMLDDIPVQQTIQLELIKEISDQRFTQGINTQRYIDTYSKVLQGLNYDSERSAEESATFYNEAYTQHYKPFMDEREYIIENYLVNHVYKNIFPFMKFPTPFDNYTMLVVHYAMIKLHLIGVAGCDKGLNEETIIFTLQSFSKAVEHNPFFLKRIFDLLQSNEYNNMAYMSILIKN